MDDQNATETRRNVRKTLESNTGERPPSVEQLWRIAARASDMATERVGETPPSKTEIETAKEDMVTALVALEMMEEKASGETDKSTYEDN